MISAPNETVTDNGPNINQVEVIIYVVILIFESTVSMLGGVLVCLTFISVRTTSCKPTSKLIVNLAVSDAAMGALVLPFTAVTVSNQAWIFGDVMCQIEGFIKTFLSQVQRSTLLLIAVDRLLRIKFRFSYGRRSHTMAYPILIMWIMNIPLAVPPLFGWSEFKWEPHKPSCTVDWLASLSYSITFLTVFGFILQGVITVCYMLIFREVRASRLRVQAAVVDHGGRVDRLGANMTPSPRHPHSNIFMTKDEIAIARTMIVLVILSSILSLPYIISHLISLIRNSPLSYRNEMTTTILVYLNNCLNPVIYGVTNSRFRQGFKTVLRWQNA